MSDVTAQRARPVHWTSSTVSRLRDTALCPVCTRRLTAGVCTSCGADLRGDDGVEVWQRASAAAEALTTLQDSVARVPRRPTPVASPTARGAAAVDRVGASPAPSLAPQQPPRASTTVQSVLAIAGAALVGLAAVIFTLLNPDLTDSVARGIILLVASLLFWGGAPLLMRRALRVSAESVAALALVFAGLAASVLLPVVAARAETWAVLTAAALAGGSLALALGVRTRMRVWMLAGSTALTLVPLLASAAIGGTPATLWGPLGTSAAALALLEAGAALERRRSTVLLVERVALVGVQVLGFVALAAAALVAIVDPTPAWLAAAAAVLGAGAVAGRSAPYTLRRLWSFAGGASVPVGFALASFALDLTAFGGDPARLALLPLAAVIGLLALTLTLSARGRVHRPAALTGATSVVAASIAPAALLAASGTLSALLAADRMSDDAVSAHGSVAAVVALVILSAGLATQAEILRRRARRAPRAVGVLRALAWWALSLGGLGALGLAIVDPGARAAWALVLATLSAVVLTGPERSRRAPIAQRRPIVIAAHLAVLLAASLSWQSTALAVGLGAAVLISLATLARTVPIVARSAHLAIGYGYGLVLVSSALSLATVEGPARLSLTATVGLLGAIAATFLRRVDAARWITVLLVASVPFAIAVGLVVVERNGWVALSTATMLVLAVSLLITRRPGLGIVIRVLAAALIVPSIAVVLVNAGAALLVMSGSPVVLPAIALVVAVTLPLMPRITAVLRHRGLPDAHGRAVGLAIEATTLLTATIAVLLCFAREAAGAPTGAIVLAIIAVGAAGAASVRRLPAYWWMFGAAAMASLWSLWLALGVTSLEAHVLPPALVAATVAVVLTARGIPRPALLAGALLAAIVPLLVALGASPEAQPARAVGLLAASVVLTGLAVSIRTGAPGIGRLRALSAPTLLAAIVAGSAGGVQAARLGLRVDGVDTALPLIAVVAIVALAGALTMGVAGVLLTQRRPAAVRRWSLVPGLTVVTTALGTAVEYDVSAPWFALTVAVQWSLMVALLVVMVVAVERSTRGTTVLPHAWVLFALALATSIVAWSPRELLRVEAFSVPLGLMLLAAGAIALRRASGADPAPVHHWPLGRAGSWPLLAPGLVVLVLASILATATDPQTWRAVLVMAIALVMILVGVRWRLAAPFVLGMLVLPLENVLAFSVQIGRGIEAMPWWITLAVVGLVLLVIAVGSERRGSGGGAPLARLRDLA
ncbi:MAG: hypothetical protein KJ659_10080 [Actinobacteria bacterium]|nr:hypothetical protein [Actinomycetota bacterium]MBU1608759.1 hypothetical protein [Actinomycetota bacterium]MBU2316334.1 hypothetical protein [Actinomycetota bacterium]MBU2385820.1 hypothetical protein [Actinomycetota bacterium]